VYIVAGNGDSARAIAICETTVFSAADGCALFGGAAHSGFIHSFSGEGISDVVGFLTCCGLTISCCLGGYVEGDGVQETEECRGGSGDDCPWAALVDSVAVDGIGEVSALASFTVSSELGVFYFWILAGNLSGLRFVLGEVCKEALAR